MSHCTCESGEIVFPQGEIGGLVHAHKGSFIYILKFCQAQAKTFNRMRTENTLRQHRVQASGKTIRDQQKYYYFRVRIFDQLVSLIINH